MCDRDDYATGGSGVSVDYRLESDYQLVAQSRVVEVNRVDFAQGDGSRMPFDDAMFDIVICAEVYEHAPHQAQLAAEIWRVLRPGGVCFFSGPNRLAVVEEHYWLPFLSWLPQTLSDAYVRLSGQGSRYDIAPLSFWQLRHLWGRFVIQDYAIEMILHPERFWVQDKVGNLHWLAKLPLPILEAAMPLMPNFNWILLKPS